MLYQERYSSAYLSQAQSSLVQWGLDGKLRTILDTIHFKTREVHGKREIFSQILAFRSDCYVPQKRTTTPLGKFLFSIWRKA